MSKGSEPRPTDNKKYDANFKCIKFGDIKERGGPKKVEKTSTGTRVVYGGKK